MSDTYIIDLSAFFTCYAGFTRLQTLIEAVSLRRTKSDQVNGRPLVSLPKKTIRLKKLTFTKEERQVYDVFFARFQEIIRKYARSNKLLSNYAHVFAMMMRLRQLSCHRELYTDINWEKDLDDFVQQAEELAAAEREGAKGASTGAKAADEADAKRLAESLAKMIREGATDDCSICVSDLTHPVITPCAHVFCLNCITTWLVRKPPPGCPLCRLPVAVKNLLEAAANNEEEVCDGEESDDENEYDDIVVNVSSTKINAVLKVRHE